MRAQDLCFMSDPYILSPTYRTNPVKRPSPSLKMQPNWEEVILSRQPWVKSDTRKDANLLSLMSVCLLFSCSLFLFIKHIILIFPILDCCHYYYYYYYYYYYWLKPPSTQKCVLLDVLWHFAYLKICTSLPFQPF